MERDQTERIVSRFLEAAYSEDTLEIVAAGIGLLLAQNYIVTNPFFDEKEIKKYLLLRRQFHGNFVEACVELAGAIEAGDFGDAVRPAIPALREIGNLGAKQEQQALRQLVRAFRGLRHLTYRDVGNPKLIKLITLARRLGAKNDEYSGFVEKDFLESLVRVQALPAQLRTLIRKVIKFPAPGKTLVETTNPGAWFDMPIDKKKGLRELTEKTQKDGEEIWDKYQDDPEKRIEAYTTNQKRLLKIQNIAGVNVGIITKQDTVPLATLFKQEAKLDSDGPTEYVRLKIESYIKDIGRHKTKRKEGDPVPREFGKLLTDIKKAKTFPTMRRVIADAVERQTLGKSSIEDVDSILSQASKNRAVRDGTPLVPLKFSPKTVEEFQVEHDTGKVMFDPEYTEEERQDLLGRVSRAISDLEGVYGKGFCGKHAKKLQFNFQKFNGTATAHYFTYDDRREWQPRVTFGPEYEGVLAHELSHYLEDLLAYKIGKQDDPERDREWEAKGLIGGSGTIFGNTGVPLERFGENGVLARSRESIAKKSPEFVEFIDAVLATPDYKRWEDKLGTAYDTAMPMAIKALTGMSAWDLPKDHPYYGLVDKARYRSDLPPELNEETQKQYKNLMGGDGRKLDYYNSSTEVWARMCEQYVYNKLIEAGISNPWLTHLTYSDDDVFMDEKTFDEKMKPIMDRLFARLKGRNVLASMLFDGEISERLVARYQLTNRVAARYQEKKKVKSEDGGETTVYVYSERQVQNRNRKKAERVQKLSKAIKKIRTKVRKDMQSSDPETKLTALAVALMDHTYERIGNDESAKEGHFGVTGWQRKHLKFDASSATIKYVGKSGVKHEKKVTDAGIRKALKESYDSLEGDDTCVLSWKDGCVTAAKVNQYLKPFDATAKDIRGYHANEEMRTRLKEVRKGALPDDKKEREKQLKEEFKEALEATAESVGHEPSTLKSQYLVPGLEDSFLKDGTIIDKLGSAVFERHARNLSFAEYYNAKALSNLPPHSHYVMVCKVCGTDFQRCRCNGEGRITVTGICDSCVPKFAAQREDKVPGGLADKKKPSDFDKAQLAKGVKVEMEHTNDSDLAEEIAMDHLTEDSDYYLKLEEMEK